jgi:hypothetical protein
MSEIYEERLEKYRYKYRGREEALKEAMELALDASLFTPEQIQTNLSELREIAEAEGIRDQYLIFLGDRVFKEEQVGEDI